MKRREFLKNGMAITALATMSTLLTSPSLLSGVSEAGAGCVATPLFSTYSANSAAMLRNERILVDYCTAKSLKTPHFFQIASTSPLHVFGERAPMIDI